MITTEFAFPLASTFTVGVSSVTHDILLRHLDGHGYIDAFHLSWSHLNELRLKGRETRERDLNKIAARSKSVGFIGAARIGSHCLYRNTRGVRDRHLRARNQRSGLIRDMTVQACGTFRNR